MQPSQGQKPSPHGAARRPRAASLASLALLVAAALCPATAAAQLSGGLGGGKAGQAGGQAIADEYQRCYDAAANLGEANECLRIGCDKAEKASDAFGLLACTAYVLGELTIENAVRIEYVNKARAIALRLSTANRNNVVKVLADSCLEKGETAVCGAAGVILMESKDKAERRAGIGYVRRACEAPAPAYLSCIYLGDRLTSDPREEGEVELGFALLGEAARAPDEAVVQFALWKQLTPMLNYVVSNAATDPDKRYCAESFQANIDAKRAEKEACEARRDAAECAALADRLRYCYPANAGASRRYYIDACAGDVAAACRAAGELTAANPQDLDDDEPEAPAYYNKYIDLLERACRGGQVSLCLDAARELGEGAIVTRDEERAGKLTRLYMEDLEEKCGDRQMDACSDLGTFYDSGGAVAQDVKKATKYYQKACRGGSGIGCHNLGTINYRKEAKRWKKKAAELFRKGCALDYAPSCDALGTMLYQGDGVRKDRRKAGEALDKACQLGSGSACNSMGWASYGDNEDAIAAQYYQKACDAGHAIACYNMTVLKWGNGRPRDEWAAKLTESCGDSFPSGCIMLAFMLYDQDEKDRAQELAGKYWQSATAVCDGGDGETCAWMGRYLRALGNGDEAAIWFGKAGDNLNRLCKDGDEGSCRIRGLLLP